VLSSALTAVLPGSDMNRRRECARRGHPRPSRRFLDDRRERNQGRLPARCGPLAAEGNLVEGPLSESAKPTVEARVVGRVLPGGRRRGRTQATGAREVLAAQVLYPSQRVLLVRKGIGGEDPPAGTAGTAARQGHRQHQTLSVRCDQGTGDQGRRQVESLRPALSAGEASQVGLDQPSFLMVDGLR
jgi:hypothetical protein